MRRSAYITIIMILALSAIGCERENLSYNKQKEPTPTDTLSPSLPDTLPSPTDDPGGTSHPDDPDDPDSTGTSTDENADSVLLSLFAKRLSGSWRGDLASAYYDYRGVKVEASGTADLTFQLSQEGAHGGAGLEVNYQDGKQVYQMPFTWRLASDHRLHIDYSDRRAMASDECRFAGDSLRLVLTATDGLETASYRLLRVTQ